MPKSFLGKQLLPVHSCLQLGLFFCHWGCLLLFFLAKDFGGSGLKEARNARLDVFSGLVRAQAPRPAFH